MPIDKNALVKNIESNLYEIESILVTPSINKLFKLNNINFENFYEIIALYLSNINLLKKYTNYTLLEILDKKLNYFVQNGQSKNNITLYYTELDSAITFISNKKDTFFPKIKTTIKQTNMQKDIFTLDLISIINFFSIKNIKLDNLKDKKEIYILGENGDGKTLLLQSIVLALKGVEEGTVFNLAKEEKKYHTSIELSNGFKLSKENIEEYKFENLLAYGTSRNILCGQKHDEVGYLTLFDNGYDLANPIEWLIKLYNIEEYNKKRKESITLPIALVKELMKNLLNSDIQIDITAEKVTFMEKGTKEVDFKRLSAGYIGVITIICDMLDRLSKKQSYITDIKEYRGIVLIDEVELHLHPKWKYNFMNKLRGIFPLIQFIVTTHSPTVILGASKEAVFYKIYKDDGEVCISEQMQNEGYTNNSLISSPLFDLKSITSRDYDKRVSSDDYIYDKIHQVVATRIKKDINIDEDEILKLIDQELDKL